MRTDYLDCCDQPALEVVRTLYQASHDLEALMRCARCQAPWFYRFHEHVTFAGPDVHPRLPPTPRLRAAPRCWS
jgi:hypothetical protein